MKKNPAIHPDDHIQKAINVSVMFDLVQSVTSLTLFSFVVLLCGYIKGKSMPANFFPAFMTGGRGASMKVI